MRFSHDKNLPWLNNPANEYSSWLKKTSKIWNHTRSCNFSQFFFYALFYFLKIIELQANGCSAEFLDFLRNWPRKEYGLKYGHFFNRLEFARKGIHAIMVSTARFIKYSQKKLEHHDALIVVVPKLLNATEADLKFERYPKSHADSRA